MLGIDPGVATTGYGLVEQKSDGELVAIGYGIIQTSPKLLLSERLNLIHEELKKILLLHKPDTAAVEKLFFQRNVTTAMSVGEARGVCLLTLVQHKIPMVEYTPLEVKQAVTGYGAAEKKQIQAMVQVILKLESLPKPDDAADALGIAICHLNHLTYNQMTHDHQYS